MDYTLMTSDATGVALSYRLKNEGKKSFILAKKDIGKIHDGMTDRVKAIPKGSLVLFDMVGAGAEAEALAEKGFPVFGASKFCDEIELKREKGVALAYDIGMDVPDSVYFQKLSDAVKYVKKSRKRLVFKPNCNLALELTYVSSSWQDMVDYLENYIPQRLGKTTFPFLLQDFVDGQQLDCEAWWNGEWFQLYNSTLESKKLLTGDLGPNIGSSCNTVWAYGPNGEGFPLRKQFDALGEVLKKKAPHFRGPVDVNVIVRKNKAYFLEFCPRLGYDAVYGLSELLMEPLSDMIEKITTGKECEPLKIGFGSTLRFYVKPYPYLKGGKEAYGIPINGIHAKNQKHIWLSDVCKENGKFICAGRDGLLGVTSAHGLTMKTSWEKCYKTVKELEIPDICYRTDGSEGARMGYNELKRTQFI